jgi:hypothetical protein
MPRGECAGMLKNTLSAVFIIAAALAIWYGTAQTIYAVVATLPLVGNPETAESHWIASFVFDLIGVVCIVLAANPRLFARVRLRR